MTNIAFRVDLRVAGEKSGLRVLNGHTWEVNDRFLYSGREWTVDAVLVKYRDGVPYPAEALCLLIAGDRDARSSVVVSADDVVLVESDA